MYLHLGMSVVAGYGDIVGVFDLDNASTSVHTRDYLSRMERNGCLENVWTDLPKSFVVCSQKKGEQRVFLTQMGTATLVKRVESGGGILTSEK